MSNKRESEKRPSSEMSATVPSFPARGNIDFTKAKQYSQINDGRLPHVSTRPGRSVSRDHAQSKWGNPRSAHKHGY